MREKRKFFTVGFYSLILGLIIFFFPWERGAFFFLSLVVAGRCFFSGDCWGEVFIIGFIFDLAWGHHLGRTSLIFLLLALLISLFKKNFLFFKNRGLKIPLK